MKTQILHLESYDDRHSILDKLEWGQADRVILFWPLRGRPLENKLDLTLIYRRCQSAGMKLALVCKRHDIKDYAQELGIPVFRSVRQAQNVAWEYTILPPTALERPIKKRSQQELHQLLQTQRLPNWTDLPATRIVAFISSLLALLTIAAYFIPSAQVQYLPQLTTQTLELTLHTDPNVANFNLSGTVPAERVTISVEGRNNIQPTGNIGIPDTPATGLIQFTNLTDQAISIPAGTVIRTSDLEAQVRFITSTAAELDAEVGDSVLIPIEAVNPGPAGNLAANTLTSIEGDLALKLFVTNPNSTSGGSETVSTAPTTEDYDRLYNLLLDSLWQNALDEAQTGLAVKDIILDSRPRKITIIAEEFSPPEPQPSPTLSLLLRVEFELMVVRWDTLHMMGNAVLDATLPEDFAAQPDTLSIQMVTEPMIGDDDTATWQVILGRQIFPSKNLAPAIQQILGRQPTQAVKILRSTLSLSANPEIAISPDWWPWMPFLDMRIKLVDLRQE